MAVLGQIITPIADMDGAFSQCESTAQIFIRVACITVNVMGEAPQPAVLPVFVTGTLRVRELTTAMLRLNTSVNGNLKPIGCQRFRARQPISLRQKAPSQRICSTAA